MSQAEITSLATLISTVIVAVLVVWRNVVAATSTHNDVTTVKADTTTINDKATNIDSKTDNIKDTVEKVAQKVDGNIDTMLAMLSDIHAATTKNNG